MRTQLLRSFICLFLTITSGIANAQSGLTDSISVVLLRASGAIVIRTMQADGSLLSEIPLDNHLVSGDLLSGHWTTALSGAFVSVRKAKSGIFRAYIIDGGLVSNSFLIGKDVLRAVALDYDSSGFADLAIQRNKGPITIYLDPGIGLNASIRIEAPERTDMLRVRHHTKDDLGFIKVYDERERAHANGVGYISYRNQIGRFDQNALPEQTSSILSLKLRGGDPAFLSPTANGDLLLFGPGTKSQKVKRGKYQMVRGGFIQSSDYSSILFGDTLGRALLVDPTTFATAPVPLDLATGSVSVDGDTACAFFNTLLAQFYAAVHDQNLDAAAGIAATLDQLATTNPCDRTEETTPKGIIGNVSFLSDTVALASNTGERMGPCIEFLPALDGTNGFLVKNSDVHPGSVYLTPGPGFTNGRILNPVTFSEIAKTPFAGIANGGRAHFRNFSKRIPWGAHVFAANLGNEVYCWKVPDGSARVD